MHIANSRIVDAQSEDKGEGQDQRTPISIPIKVKELRQKRRRRSFFARVPTETPKSSSHLGTCKDVEEILVSVVSLPGNPVDDVNESIGSHQCQESPTWYLDALTTSNIGAIVFSARFLCWFTRQRTLDYAFTVNYYDSFVLGYSSSQRAGGGDHTDGDNAEQVSRNSKDVDFRMDVCILVLATQIMRTLSGEEELGSYH